MEHVLRTLYCRECVSGNVNPCTIPWLYEKFSQLPVDDKLRITEPFYIFEAGTPVEDILNWFDKHCPGGIEYLKEHGKGADAVSE